MTINKRLRLTVWISLNMIVLMICTLVWSFLEVDGANKNILLTENMRKAALERIFMRDDYLLNPSERARIQWYTKTESLRALMESASERFTDPEDRTLLQEIRKDFDTIYLLFSKITEKYKQAESAGTRKSAFSETKSRLINQIFLKAYLLNDNIDRLHESFHRAGAKAERTGAIFLLLFVVGNVIAMVINSIFTGGIVAKRAIKLAEGVAIIGAGNLDHRIEMKGDDELSELANATNEMMVRLRESLTSVVNLQKEVAEREQVEESLRESEEKFRAMVETIPLAIHLTVGIEQVTKYVNPTMVKLFGYTIEDIPSIEQWWPLAYPDEIYRRQISEEWNKRVKRALETQSPIEPMEVVVNCKDGSKKNISWGYITLGDKNYSCGLDLTERKQAEEAIQALNAELEQRVAKRTEQLEAANKELEAFSYSVSHDLRAPLRHISGFADMLLKDVYDQLSDKARHYLDTINDSARKMGILIDDLLSFSRTGRAAIKKSTFSMNQAVADALAQVELSIADRTIDVNISQLPEVFADYNLLRLTWINLLDNAVKYTRTREKSVIHIDYNEEKEEYVFIIRDNGVGFDMKYAQKLFGVFQRLHSTADFEGTGIGLANVHSIIFKHGGRTWAEAELEKGAAFYFTLPKSKENES